MSALVADPIAALLAAGEGRFEWKDGSLLPMGLPSDEDADEMGFLYSTMKDFAAEGTAGRVMPDSYPERLEAGIVRIPDVAFFKKSSLGRMRRTHSEGGADLIIEIVSPDSRRRDWEEKRAEYERAGVEEYWIVDPERREAAFYRLREGDYIPVESDSEGKIHSSALPGFFIRVEWLWNRPSWREVYRELGLL